MSEPTDPEVFDPRRRRLCPDGSCVGVIGADGRCRVCGSASPDGAAAPGLGPEAFAGGCADDGLDDHEDDTLEAAGDSAEDGAAGPGFDTGRRLCPDGACLGVLGADGRCNVCGRTAEG
jgi:hypothetical protein